MAHCKLHSESYTLHLQMQMHLHLILYNSYYTMQCNSLLHVKSSIWQSWFIPKTTARLTLLFVCCIIRQGHYYVLFWTELHCIALPCTGPLDLAFQPSVVKQRIFFNPSLRLRSITPQSASIPVITKNEVREFVPRLLHTSPIEFIFGWGRDKCVTFIWV